MFLYCLVESVKVHTLFYGKKKTLANGFACQDDPALAQQLKKKGQANPSPIGNIEQAEFLVLLGVTF